MTTASKPFRFSIRLPDVTDPSTWRKAVRHIEDLGYATVTTSDHFTGGSMMEPTVALTAAAEATRALRVLCMVHGNDYRHPVMLHKAAAMIDVLSDGRVELGLGAGWMVTDYEAAGMPYDPPGVRISRLAEAVTVVKGLFAPGPFSFTGQHYRIHALEGLPHPVQRPHPPLVIGGGGRRVLTLAGREADIVGINANLKHGVIGPELALDFTGEVVERKVSWVREAAAAAGRDPEIQVNTFMVRITSSAEEARQLKDGVAGMFGADPSLVEDSPAVLIGSIEECCEMLTARRERWGMSYVGLGADPDAAAPIVAKLAGT